MQANCPFSDAAGGELRITSKQELQIVPVKAYPGNWKRFGTTVFDVPKGGTSRYKRTGTASLVANPGTAI